MMIKPMIGLLRPRQWIKNCFVLLPLFFNGSILEGQLFLSELTMTVAFCFAASGIYCLNDICDAEADRLHPIKRLRPIAYCIRLKQMAIVDVFIIAAGYVLRIVAGGMATCVSLSHWMVLMTFLLAQPSCCLKTDSFRSPY